MSKQVTAEDVVEWIKKVQKVYHVEAYAKNFADKINALLAEKDAENERLRAALAVFADNNWIGAELDQFGQVRSWNLRGSLPCPWEAAAEVLKGCQPCPGK